MSHKISFFNQKGGVGKTTLTRNIAYQLSKIGKKVLVIDFDHQASLTLAFGLEVDSLEKDIVDIIEAVDVNPKIEKEELNKYINSVGENIDLIASSSFLAGAEFSWIAKMQREYHLKNVVEKIEELFNYDYILIDCNPSLGILPINALTASDGVVVPIKPDLLSSKALEMLFKTVYNIKRNLNKDLKIVGVVYNQYNPRLKITKTIDKMIEEAFGEHVYIFDNRLPLSTVVENAIFDGISVSEYNKNHKVADSFKNLTDEFIKRV